MTSRTNKVEIEGARELRAALKAAAGDLDDLKAVHAEVAEVVERAASTLVPRRTGRLAGTLRSSGQARGGVVRAGRARVPYAGPIHFGWPARNIRPQPFLFDALDRRRDDVIDAYRAQVAAIKKRHDL